MPQHLSKEEFLAPQNLRKNKNIIIQKYDKVNSVVTFDKTDYLDKVKNIKNDAQKFIERMMGLWILLSTKKSVLSIF